MPTIPIFEPVDNPVQQVVSAVNPMALRPGQFKEIDNGRVGNGLISARGAMTAALGTIETAATDRGSWHGIFNGTSTMFQAYLKGGAVIVEKSTDGITWTEITAASGKYGNTRLSDAQVFFEIIPSPENGSLAYLLIQNGTDNPRVWDGTDTSIHSAITPPRAVQNTPVKLTLPDFFIIRDSGETAYTNSGANLVGADATLTGGTATTDSVNRFTVTAASIANNDNSIVVFATEMVGNSTNHGLIVGVSTSIPDLWDYFKLEIGIAGPSYGVIYDPTDTQYPRPIPISLDDAGNTVWYFDMRGRWGDTYGVGINTIERYRLTYKVPATGAAFPVTGTPTFDIFMFALAGWCPGNTDFGISYEGHTWLESPGVEFINYETPKPRDCGGPTLLYGNVPLPRSPVLRFVPKIPYQDCTTTDLAKGISKLNVYIRQRWNGDTELYRYKQQTVASYDGVTDNRWEYSSTGTATPTSAPYTLFVTLDYTDPNYKIIMPDYQHLPIPVGKGIKWANSRLFVGSTSGNLQGIAFSRRNHPFRFRFRAAFADGTFDPDAPGVATNIKGVPTAFVAMSASLQGSSLIYAWTPEGVWAFSGLNADQLQQTGQVSTLGTISPYSVAPHSNGTIFYLGSDMQVVEMSGGSGRSITRSIIDDKFAAIPASRRAYAKGAVHSDLYYLAYTPSGQTTNTKCAVWDMDPRSRIWVTDTPPVSIEGIMSWFDSTLQKFRLITIGGTDLKAYEYDDLNTEQDLTTTNISVTITPWELHQPNGNLLFVGDQSIMCDDATGGTWTFTRTMKPHGNIGTSTLTADVSTNQVLRKDGDAISWSNTAIEGNGTSCLLSAVWSTRSGKNLYRWLCDWEDRGAGHDR